MTEQRTPGADPAAPLDDVDAAVLAEVARLLDDVDPVPDDLVDRMRFALALDEVYDEVAEMTRVQEDALAVRTELAGATRVETVTFSAELMTAMVTMSPSGPGQVRLDGWVSPAGRRRVALRMQGAERTVSTDDTGRFVLEGLRSGFVQLVFHPVPGDGSAADGGVVVTPLFKL